VRTVVVETQGVRLRLRGEEIIAEQAGTRLVEVRLGEVAQLVLMGSIELTPSLRSALLRRGIDTVFLTRTGRYLGRLAGRAHGNAAVRVAQYRRLLDPAQAARLARAIVRGKIVNQRRLLVRAQARRPRDERAAAIVRLGWYVDAVARETDLEKIRGIEGQAAAEYFGAFGTLLLNEDFSFHARTRRPPRDPVNAMLSFGYAILQAVVEGAVNRAGLDPFLGALHATRHGATALVFDLMEEFRPLVVDSTVVSLINHRQVTPGDFRRFLPGTEAEEILAREFGEGEDGSGPAGEPGVHLAESGRKIVVRAIYRALRRRAHHPGRGMRLTLAHAIVEQAYAVARWLESGRGDYVPYTPR